MYIVLTIISDFLGLWRVCGPIVALRWLMAFLPRVVAVLRARTLQPIDRALGAGPFVISLPTTDSFYVSGYHVVSGIREMYVRDCYLRGG